MALCLLGADLAAQSSTPYGKAAQAADEGKSVKPGPSLAGAKRKVDISATVLIVSDRLTSSLSADVQKFVFPTSDDARAIRVNVSPPPGEAPKWSIQVTPRTDEQVSLLNDAVRRSKHGAVASIFGMRVTDTQQVHIQLMPDRKFPLIGEGGQPQTETVRERGQLVKKAKLVERDVHISLRPVTSENGRELWLRFNDKQRPIDPYPPTSMSQSVGWSFPGDRKVRLGPPEYEFAANKSPAADYIKVPPSGQLMISGIMAIGGEQVRQGVPILDMIPVVGEAVFSSRSTVHYKISVLAVLEVQLAR